ncbi:MAG: hypothetical protein RIQ79_2460, partial [Verrucomicrobiota bacterium]
DHRRRIKKIHRLAALGMCDDKARQLRTSPPEPGEIITLPMPVARMQTDQTGYAWDLHAGGREIGAAAK